MANKTTIEKAIENADKLYQLVSNYIITIGELRKMLGLKGKPNISRKKDKSQDKRTHRFGIFN